MKTFLVGLALTLPAAAAMAAAAPSQNPRESRGMAYYHFLSGALSADEGNLDRALTELDEAVRLDQAAADIRVELADVYLRAGDTEKAVANAREAVRRGAEDPESHRSLAEALTAGASRREMDPDLLAEAIQEYVEVVRLKGADAEVLSVLGRLQMQADRPDEAIGTFEKLLETGFDAAQAHLLLGRALLRAGRGPEAADHYAKVLERSPRHAEALSNLALLQEEAQQWDEAAGTYAVLEQIRPTEASIRFHHGLCLLRAGRAREALGPLRKATEMSPANLGASRALAMALRQAAQPAEALQRYRDLLATSPEDFFVLIELAGLRAEREERREAADLFDRALALAEKKADLAPMRADTAAALARIELMLGDPEAAIKAVDRAGQSPEPSADLLLLRTRALLDAGRASDAGSVARDGRRRFASDERFVWLEPEIALVSGDSKETEQWIGRALAAPSARPVEFLRAAEMWSRQGHPEAGVKILAAGAERFASDDRIQMEFGAALDRAGRLDDAVAALRRALALNPDSHQVLNFLGYLLADSGRELDEARGLIEKAVSLSPDNGAYLDSLGWVLYRQGRSEEAVEPLARAAELLAGDATVREHYGDLLYRLGRFAEAEKNYQEAIARGGPRQRIEGKIKHGPPVEKETRGLPAREKAL